MPLDCTEDDAYTLDFRHTQITHDGETENLPKINSKSHLLPISAGEISILTVTFPYFRRGSP